MLKNENILNNLQKIITLAALIQKSTIILKSGNQNNKKTYNLIKLCSEHFNH